VPTLALTSGPASPSLGACVGGHQAPARLRFVCEAPPAVGLAWVLVLVCAVLVVCPPSPPLSPALRSSPRSLSLLCLPLLCSLVRARSRWGPPRQAARGLDARARHGPPGLSLSPAPRRLGTLPAAGASAARCRSSLFRGFFGLGLVGLGCAALGAALCAVLPLFPCLVPSSPTAARVRSPRAPRGPLRGRGCEVHGSRRAVPVRCAAQPV